MTNTIASTEVNLILNSKVRFPHPRKHLGRLDIEGTVKRDYQKKGDSIFWVLQKSACIKSEYTEADRRERAEFDAAPVLENGQIVLIDGEAYTVKVNGDYSDCAYFIKVE